MATDYNPPHIIIMAEVTNITPDNAESTVLEEQVNQEVQQASDKVEVASSECAQVELVESLVKEIQNQEAPLITDSEAQRNEIAQLKAALLAREKEVKEKDEIIAQLTESTRQQTSKINTLAKQLIKVETLLQRLGAKRKEPNLSVYRTPQSRKLGIDIDAVQQTSSLYNNLPSSHRSHKHEFLGSTQSRIEASSYVARSPMASPYRKKMDNGELSRYRREKLMEMQTVGDVLKMEKMLNGY